MSEHRPGGTRRHHNGRKTQEINRCDLILARKRFFSENVCETVQLELDKLLEPPTPQRDHFNIPTYVNTSLKRNDSIRIETEVENRTRDRMEKFRVENKRYGIYNPGRYSDNDSDYEEIAVYENYYDDIDPNYDVVQPSKRATSMNEKRFASHLYDINEIIASTSEKQNTSPEILIPFAKGTSNNVKRECIYFEGNDSDYEDIEIREEFCNQSANLQNTQQATYQPILNNEKIVAESRDYQEIKVNMNEPSQAEKELVTIDKLHTIPVKHNSSEKISNTTLESTQFCGNQRMPKSKEIDSLFNCKYIKTNPSNELNNRNEIYLNYDNLRNSKIKNSAPENYQESSRLNEKCKNIIRNNSYTEVKVLKTQNEGEENKLTQPSGWSVNDISGPPLYTAYKRLIREKDRNHPDINKICKGQTFIEIYISNYDINISGLSMMSQKKPGKKINYNEDISVVVNSDAEGRRAKFKQNGLRYDSIIVFKLENKLHVKQGSKLNITFEFQKEGMYSKYKYMVRPDEEEKLICPDSQRAGFLLELFIDES